MTRLIVHHCTDSRSFRTIWLLHEMGLDFEVVTHEFGQNLQDSNFLAISPVGRVPALEHGGLCLSESGAITEYLCETFPTPLFRAPGSTERPQWLQWLHLAETMGQLLANLTQQHIVIWEDKDRSPLVMKLERRRLEKLLDHINQTLADQPFLLPSGFSAVDIHIGYGVWVAQHFTPLEERPNVATYLDRLMPRPAFQASLPPEDAPRIYRKAFYPLP